MKILFNPPTGSDIKSFYFEGTKYFDESNPTLVLAINSLKQFPDSLADFMLEQWEFLQKVTVEEAEVILKKPSLEFRCQHCDFATDTKIALAGHNRKHKDEAEKAKQPAIDPNIIPVVGAKEVATPTPNTLNEPKDITETIGTDKDGVPWYGEGHTEEYKSFSTVPEIGKGHFGGEPLHEG